MQRLPILQARRDKIRLKSFTLVELLVVIGVIAILVAIALQALPSTTHVSARNRARGEIQALSAALEGYKNDNGAYPQTNLLLTNTALSPYNSLTVDGSSAGGLYVQSSQLLYRSLSGQTNFLDTPVPGKAYMSFKINQLGNTKTAAGTPYAAMIATYIQDPWTYSYGYSTGSTNGSTVASYPYNGSGFYDLWSTAGLLTTSANNAITNTGTWISNW